MLSISCLFFSEEIVELKVMPPFKDSLASNRVSA